MVRNSNRSPSVQGLQFDMNSSPIRGGASSIKSPDRSLLWQRLHVLIYSSSPRALCSDENTPAAMVFAVAEGSGRAISTSVEDVGIPVQPATKVQLKSRHKKFLPRDIGIKNFFQSKEGEA